MNESPSPIGAGALACRGAQLTNARDPDEIIRQAMSSPCRSATARLGAGSGARVSIDAQNLTAQREALIAARVLRRPRPLRHNASPSGAGEGDRRVLGW